MSLGENIRNIRKSKGYSIMKIKELTGLSKSTISELENDKSSPTSETLQKIAIALEVPITVFFDAENFNDNNLVKYYVSYEKLKFLREKKKLTQTELTQLLDLKNKSTIGKLERVEIGVDDELLTKLSLFFNVSKKFLISIPDGINEITTCPICKTEYYPFDAENYDEHEITHINFKKCGIDNIYIDYHEREELKKECIRILQSDAFSPLDKYNSAIKYFQCYYSRSIEIRNFSPNHVKFDEYISMLLNERDKEILKKIPDHIYKLLVNQFGKKEGMSTQETYAPLKQFDAKATNEEIELLDKYSYLDDKGRHTINTILDIEYKRCKNKLTKNNITRFNTTTKEEYNFAAHADGLDKETAKRTADKAKAIFKQMDEE